MVGHMPYFTFDKSGVLRPTELFMFYIPKPKKADFNIEKVMYVLKATLHIILGPSTDFNKKLEPPCQHNKQNHMKVLLSSFSVLEWSHTRVLSTDVKVKTTLCSIINSTT